jgi:hypothetical protein
MVMTMNRSMLNMAAALSDRDLLSRLQHLAGRERAALVELLAHLAELDTRRSVYAAEGYGSLFAYCTGALRLSEDAAYNRIEAARACRRFPDILDLLADGSVTLTSVRMIARHLTPENQTEVLVAAKRRTKAEIEALVARLAPRPDAAPVIRRLAERAALAAPVVSTTVPAPPSTTVPVAPLANEPPRPAIVSSPPVIRASAPARFLVQLTVGQETHDRFRRLQALCARECRGGDPVAVFDLACRVLEERQLKAKRAETKRPAADPLHPRTTRVNGRHIPATVSREVCRRDRNQCAFVAASGIRCTERKYLELHHIEPWALGGEATATNISVRCRTHNVFEAEQVFGARALRSQPADRARPKPPSLA